MVVMRCLDAHACLNGDTQRLPHGQTRLFFDIFFERDAVYKFHNDVVNPVIFSDVIHIYNIRMHQTGCRLGFYPEFGYEIRIFGKFLLQHFHRYMPVQFVILCLINI